MQEIEVREFLSHGIPVLQTHVKSEAAAKALHKACGLYTTITTGALDQLVEGENVCSCLAEQLQPHLAPFFGKNLCICGIGNQDLDFDSLGPETVKRITPQLYDMLSLRSNFDHISLICPSVKGLTNLETDVIVSGIAAAADAACVITIDASSCDKCEDLCSSIQLTDQGMESFHGTVRLNTAVIGVPVISIGVPTSLCANRLPLKDKPPENLILTPIRIKESTQTAAFIIACALAQVIYPDLDYGSYKECLSAALYGIL